MQKRHFFFNVYPLLLNKKSSNTDEITIGGWGKNVLLLKKRMLILFFSIIANIIHFDVNRRHSSGVE